MTRIFESFTVPVGAICGITWAATALGATIVRTIIHASRIGVTPRRGTLNANGSPNSVKLGKNLALHQAA